jgi:hypothetical protein
LYKFFWIIKTQVWIETEYALENQRAISNDVGPYKNFHKKIDLLNIIANIETPQISVEFPTRI